MGVPDENDVKAAVPWRAVLIAVALSVLSVWWIHQASLVQAPGNRYAPVYILSVPPVPAVFCLLLLVVLAPLSRRLLRRGLTNPELLVVFMFLVISIPPTTIGIIQALIPWQTSVVYFETPQNEFALMSQALPRWFYPHDPGVIRQMYEGSPDGTVPWGAWLYPLSMWTLFLVLGFLTLACVNSLFRKQWVEAEHLRFPLLFIPISVVDAEPPGSRVPFLRNPLVWAAFVIVITHHLLNVMHSYNPAVIALMDRTRLGYIFTERPWTAYRGLSFFHRPQMIGLAYFMPVDVLFSAWFFYLLMPTLVMFTEVFGLQADPRFPYRQEQGVGAYVALFFILLWTARGHIRAIVDKALYGSRVIRDDDEPLGYRTMFFGAIAGFAGLILWTHAMGLSAACSIPLFFMLVVFAVVYSRVRAEAGVPTVWAFPFTQDTKMIRYAFGTRGLIHGRDVSDLALLNSFGWMTWGCFSSQMAYHMENIALADRRRIRSRSLTAMMAGALVVGCIVGYYLNLSDYYQYGALTLHGGTASGGYNIQVARRGWQDLSGALNSPGLPNYNALAGFGVGAVLTVAMVSLRWTWLRSPLHPLGYAMVLNHGYALWAPFLVTWMIKIIVHRLGGARLFRQLMPFFVGLALADLLIGGISWIIMGAFGSDILGGYMVQFG